MRYGQIASSLVLLCIALPASAQIFDNSSLTFNGDISVIGQIGYATLISPATSKNVTAFSMEDKLNSAGNVKFFIYDNTTSAFAYTSAAKAFGADGIPTFKTTDPISVVLLATDQYYFGIVADVITDNPYRSPATNYSQGGLTSQSTYREFDGFSTLTPGTVSTNADLPLKVFGAAVTTPEPGSIGLLGSVGAAGSLWTLRLRRRRK